MLYLIAFKMKYALKRSSRYLTEETSKLKKTEGWRRALGVLNADAVKKDLETVWKGIERAMRNTMYVLSLLCIPSVLMLPLAHGYG